MQCYRLPFVDDKMIVCEKVTLPIFNRRHIVVSCSVIVVLHYQVTTLAVQLNKPIESELTLQSYSRLKTLYEKVLSGLERFVVNGLLCNGTGLILTVSVLHI